MRLREEEESAEAEREGSDEVRRRKRREGRSTGELSHSSINQPLSSSSSSQIWESKILLTSVDCYRRRRRSRSVSCDVKAGVVVVEEKTRRVPLAARSTDLPAALSFAQEDFQRQGAFAY